LARAGILEVRFRVEPKAHWMFAGAHATPALRRYGSKGVDLLARALQAKNS
jgi:hypothetical protein